MKQACLRLEPIGMDSVLLSDAQKSESVLSYLRKAT